MGVGGWGVPYRTHRRLLSHITDELTVEIILAKRFLKHFLSGYQNNNYLLKTVFQSSMYGVSRLSRDFRHLANRHNLPRYNIEQIKKPGVNNYVESSWRDTFMEKDVLVGKQIKKVCQWRDRLDDRLNKQQITDIIYDLPGMCTLTKSGHDMSLKVKFGYA